MHKLIKMLDIKTSLLFGVLGTLGLIWIFGNGEAVGELEKLILGVSTIVTYFFCKEEKPLKSEKEEILQVEVSELELTNLELIQTNTELQKKYDLQERQAKKMSEEVKQLSEAASEQVWNDWQCQGCTIRQELLSLKQTEAEKKEAEDRKLFEMWKEQRDSNQVVENQQGCGDYGAHN